MIARRELLVLSGASLLAACGEGGIEMPGHEARLRELGIKLPKAPKPVATYVPFRRVGNLLWVAGQGPALDAEFARGKLGQDLNVEQGYAAARSTAINILAQLKSALGSINGVRKCVKIGGFVNCTSDFTDQPKVINGASDLFAQVFGEKGKAARFAVGAPSLPFNVAVEIESIWEVR